MPGSSPPTLRKSNKKQRSILKKKLKYEKAIADTGCTGHHFAVKAFLRNLQRSKTPLRVGLADDSVIESTHEGFLPIDGLPLEATRAHLFPAFGQTSPLSIGQLCDYGCDAKFNATSMKITYQGRVILEGSRTPPSRDCELLMSQPLNKLLLLSTSAPLQPSSSSSLRRRYSLQQFRRSPAPSPKVFFPLSQVSTRRHWKSTSHTQRPQSKATWPTNGKTSTVLPK